MWYDDGEPRGWDRAQICENGHVVNAHADSMPDFNENFCSRCGKPTLLSCPNCGGEIRGRYHSPGVLDGTALHAPGYCYVCGKAYPWTQERLAAAQALVAEEESLDPALKAVFTDNVGYLIGDQPRTQLAAQRVNNVLRKMARPVADAVRSLLVEIISETAKKIIMG